MITTRAPDGANNNDNNHRHHRHYHHHHLGKAMRLQWCFQCGFQFSSQLPLTMLQCRPYSHRHHHHQNHFMHVIKINNLLSSQLSSLPSQAASIIRFPVSYSCAETFLWFKNGKVYAKDPDDFNYHDNFNDHDDFNDHDNYNDHNDYYDVGNVWYHPGQWCTGGAVSPTIFSRDTSLTYRLLSMSFFTKLRQVIIK